MVSIADVTDPKSVGPRIRMMKPHLTPLEAKVVNSVMARRDFSHETALKEVADEAGVSEAMVIKIAKKLGFSGYRDFRQNLVDYARVSDPEMREELSPADSPREIVNKVFRRLQTSARGDAGDRGYRSLRSRRGFHRWSSTTRFLWGGRFSPDRPRRRP